MARTLRERVEAARPHVRMLSLAEAKALIDAGNVTLIEVGEAWQLVERGTIAGARNIARGEFEIPADSELPRRDLRLQDRAQKIILTCGGGGKATLAASALMEIGFTNVSAIKGGCEGWRQAGYPLVRPARADRG